MYNAEYLMISEAGSSQDSVRGGRRRCNDFPAIDIRHPLHRELIETLGGRISWQWNCNRNPFCHIDIVFHRDHVVLTDVTDGMLQQALSVSLLRTPCHYGATRSWFECPGCKSRCAKLYFRNSNFCCRKCHGLGYKSQLVASGDRSRLIAQRIRRSLGGSSNLFLPFPDKPPRMHWRTYLRICAKANKHEAKVNGRLTAWVERHQRSNAEFLS
jgi:hypothetical protein